MWRYAGINDINRIIGASVATTAFQVIGTLIFVMRIADYDKVFEIVNY
jgi:hypothetical protein